MSAQIADLAASLTARAAGVRMDLMDWSAWDRACAPHLVAANDDEPGFGRGAPVMRALDPR